MCPLEIQIHSKEETHEAKPDRERQNQERDAPVSRVTHYPGELPRCKGSAEIALIAAATL
jgi:hypothetical protein